MKHKPILMRKILEDNNSKVIATDDAFDTHVIHAGGLFQRLFLFVLKYVYVPFLIYFILRFFGFDVYRPFGDSVLNFFKAILTEQ